MTLAQDLELYVVVVVASPRDELVMCTILADFAFLDEVSESKVSHWHRAHA